MTGYAGMAAAVFVFAMWFVVFALPILVELSEREGAAKRRAEIRARIEQMSREARR